MVDAEQMWKGALAFVMLGVFVSVVLSTSGFGGATVVFNFISAGETVGVDSNMDAEDAVVEVTNGGGVYFDGSDADAVSLDKNGDLTNGPWTVGIVAELDGDANQAARRDLYGVNNGSIILQYASGEYEGYYYYNDSHSAYVNGTASSVGSLTAVNLRWDGDRLTLYEDGTQSDTAPLTTTEPPRTVSNNWRGTIDEARQWNESLAESAIGDYAAEPARPLAGTNHDARLMFDGEGRSGPAYYHPDDAELVGVERNEFGVENPPIAEGTDYELSSSPFELSVLAGVLAESPTIYVRDGSGGAGSIVQLIVLVGVVLGGVRVVTAVTDINL